MDEHEAALQRHVYNLCDSPGEAARLQLPSHQKLNKYEHINRVETKSWKFAQNALDKFENHLNRWGVM